MAENDGKTAPALPPRPASRQSPSYSNYGTIPQHAPNKSSKCVLILNLVVPLCLMMRLNGRLFYDRIWKLWWHWWLYGTIFW